MPSLTHLTLALTSLASALPIGNRSGTFVGDMTYYEPGLGACGQTSSASEAVVALSTAQYYYYEGSSSTTTNCGRTILILKNGKTASAKVVDKCPSCAAGAIDVSPAVFQSLAPLAVGRTTVSWAFE